MEAQMATFEAHFSDGLVARFEADTMTIEEGVIVLLKEADGGRTAVAAIGSDELLFIRDTAFEVELEEPEYEDEEEEDED
jgi:hypothetical protein